MIKAILRNLLIRLGYEQLGVFFGYLRASGWLKSLSSKSAIDFDRNPLPWYNYSTLHFLSERISSLTKKVESPKLKVFEFGSGNSTLWWANRVAEVISVEDDGAWYAQIKKSKPENVTYLFAPNRQEYIDALMKSTDLFHLIVVDGSYREACLDVCHLKLNSKGVLIVDNSDWSQLQPCISKLEKLGFRQLEFFGLGPINGHPWGTSIFYKPDNILGI